MRKRSILGLFRAAAILACLVAPAAAAQYILQIKTGASVTQIASRYGLVVVKPFSDDGHTVYLVSGPDPSSAALVKLVLADSGVSSFEADQAVCSHETSPASAPIANTAALGAALVDHSSTAYFGATVRSSYVHQPSATLINLPTAQSLATGSGIVAVIDTGIDYTHPALKGVLVPGYDFIHNLPGLPSDLSDLNQSTVAILDQSTVAILDSKRYPVMLNQSTVAILDQSTVAILDGSKLPADFGHGTMVAGLIHLVAPTARIMPLKAFSADGTGDLANIVSAIYYAVNNGAKVINMSFSAPAPSTSLTAALQYAWSHNVICVASGGNDGKKGMVVYPAADHGTLGIGSTNAQDRRSAFSNYSSPSVRFAAPGEALITTYPGNNYAGVWGTSFSTALTSGAFAVMLQVSPHLKAGDLSDTLEHGHPLEIGMGDARLDLYSMAVYCMSHH